MMEQCVLCGVKFEPLPLPEVSEIFGMKSLHKQVCPACVLKETAKALNLISEIVRELQKPREVIR